jgi:hypothetical protein
MKIPKIRDDEIETACSWARADAEDDFCPDYVRYADYGAVTSQHIPMLRMSCLRPDLHQLARLVIPRGAGILSRDTAWFPFPLRVTYMLLLRRLLPSLRACVSPSCYSSRLDEWDGDAYPWGGPRVAPWAQFRNDYRKLVIDHGSEGLAIETDVTAFYEHISIVEFVEILEAVLRDRAASVNDELRALESLLRTAAFKGRGLPQNMDPSRFLADAYLRVVDDRVRAIPDASYLRWVDDIRIVARTRGTAVRVFRQLEAHLKANGLFLNSKKTLLITAKDAEWAKIKDANHDFKLAQCDDLLRQATKTAVEECIQVAIDGMRGASQGDDPRLVRAYGNRLLRAGHFTTARPLICGELQDVAIRGFRQHPGDAEQWAAFVAPALSDDGVRELLSALRTPDYNSHAWTNMWVIIAMARAQSLPGEAMDTLRSIVLNRSEPDYLRGWAAVAFARHGDGLQRREVVDACLVELDSMFLRRAAVMAAQELPSATRSDVRTQTLARDPALALLWDHLERHRAYDWYVPQSREFAAAGTKPEEVPSFEAVGLVDGRLRKFKAYSRGNEYEVG